MSDVESNTRWDEGLKVKGVCGRECGFQQGFLRYRGHPACLGHWENLYMVSSTNYIDR